MCQFCRNVEDPSKNFKIPKGLWGFCLILINPPKLRSLKGLCVQDFLILGRKKSQISGNINKLKYPSNIFFSGSEEWSIIKRGLVASWFLLSSLDQSLDSSPGREHCGMSIKWWLQNAATMKLGSNLFGHEYDYRQLDCIKKSSYQ